LGMTIQSNLRRIPNAFSHPILAGRAPLSSPRQSPDVGVRGKEEPDSAASETPERPGACSAPEVLSLRPPSTLQVLLVDDCRISQLLTRSVFADWSIRMHSAVSGRDGIRKAIVHRFDIILMDIEMPDCDGFAAAAFIRAYGAAQGLPRVPIVAFSNSPRVDDMQELARAGIDDVLSKPCHSDSLSLCLHRLLPHAYAAAEKAPRAERLRA